MTKRKKKAVIRRAKKYKKKVLPRVVNLIFKENLPFYSIDLRDYLRLDSYLEKETLNLLEQNIRLGIIKTEEKDLYLAFWRKIRELGQKFTGETLQERIKETINEFIERGLNEQKLKEIVELVKEQLPRKRLFERLKEWAVIQDYLKIKAIAYITPVIKFDIPILPLDRLIFDYEIRPLAERVFNVRPKTLVNLFFAGIIPYTKLFSLDLRNKINLNFLYNIERFLEFTFWLRPKTILFFDYDISATTFNKFSLTTTVSYELIYQTIALLPTFYTLRPKTILQFSYFVFVVPFRTISLRPKVMYNLIAYVPTVNLMRQEITPLPRVLLNAYVPTTTLSQNEIKRFLKVQFSYSVSQA